MPIIAKRMNPILTQKKNNENKKEEIKSFIQ